jgi:hypothetical protein
MKPTITVFVLAFVTFNLQAQVSLIPKVGLSVANYQITHRNVATQPEMGLIAGVGVNIVAGKTAWLSFQPELIYIQKAFSSQQTEIVPEVETIYIIESKRRNDYLEMPLLLKVQFGKPAVKGFVNAGPSLGLHVGSREQSQLSIAGKGPFNATAEMLAAPVGEATNFLEVGLQVGAGIGVKLGAGLLLLEARYGLGLTNFVKAHQVAPYVIKPADDKSRTVGFTFGYVIPLKLSKNK